MSSQVAAPIRGRLAPSPTGVLHLGNARSFLLAWLDVRAQQGQLVLRIEDLDGPRIQHGAADSILEDLAWLGLDWDEGPTTQRDRLAEYRAVLDAWHQAGWVYPCVCTRRDVEAAASAPHAGDESPIYPGTCRGLYADAQSAHAATGKSVAWRFAVPPDCTIQFDDGIAGRQQFRVDQELGDFVVWKKDDEPAYQLAVVVDDVRASIQQVLRGDDLLPSAARQELLYAALAAPPPLWLHVPLVVGTDGRRLAKRHGDTSLRSLREMGVQASQVLAWCARVSGIELDTTPQSAHDLLARYQRRRIPKQAVIWSGLDELSA
jgi:glutamyl-tRNA synthetase